MSEPVETDEIKSLRALVRDLDTQFETARRELEVEHVSAEKRIAAAVASRDATERALTTARRHLVNAEKRTTVLTTVSK
jgi:hypothetical protein